MLPLQGFPGPPKALKMSLLVFRKQSRVFDSESLFEPSKAMDGYVSPSPPEGVCAGGPQSKSATKCVCTYGINGYGGSSVLLTDSC